MKIGIVGVGYAGLVTRTCLAHIGNNIICYDVDENKLSILHFFSLGKIILLDRAVPFSKHCLLTVQKHQLINVTDISSNSDSLLKYLAFIFNFNYKESLIILKEKGYIDLIFDNLNYQLYNADLNIIKKDIFNYLNKVQLKGGKK